MSALGPEDRALVLRHLAALRRSGVPASLAVRQVSNALPGGEAKAVLAQLADSLDRGEAGGDTSDPLLAIVARGESAIPEVLDTAADAYALKATMQDATRMAGLRLSVVLGIVGAVGVAMFPVAGEFGRVFGGFGMSLPAPTAFIIDGRAAWLVLGLATLLAAVAVALRPELVTGPLERRLVGADATRIGLVSAASAAGLDEARALSVAGFSPSPNGSLSVLGLSRLETEATEWVRATQGFTRATAFAAASGAADARRLLRLLALGFEVGAAVVLGVVVGGALVAFYLPIFAIAGPIR